MPDHDRDSVTDVGPGSLHETARDAELRLPAETAYVAVLRMTTAGLAARLDFTLDDIEDLRMAVGEACALVLEGADGHGQLHARFELGVATMRVHVSADAAEPTEPDTDSFGWQMLSALAADLVLEDTDSRHGIAFTVKSAVTV